MKRKIFLVCCLCLLVMRTYASEIAVISYVLPTGVTLFFALPNDGSNAGKAVLVGASPNSYYDSLGTMLFFHSYNDVSACNIFDDYCDLAAYTAGGCHYQNEHESSYNGTLYDVVIPDTITFPNGSHIPVVEIYFHAFAHADWIQSVTIPYTINVVGPGAFFHCRNLEKIVFEPKITGEDYGLYIKQWAFAACYGLKKLEINRVCSVEPACFFNNVIDTVIINRNFGKTGLSIYSLQEQDLTQHFVEAQVYYRSPFYHQGPEVGTNDTSWRGHTMLILGDSVLFLRGKVFEDNFGGDTMIFPRGLKCLDYWSTLHHNYILPDSLENFGLLDVKEATSLTIPDGISTWIQLGYNGSVSNQFHNISGDKLIKLTIGKGIYAIHENNSILDLSSLDTVVIKSRKIRQMNVRSFPVQPIVLIVPCGKLDDYRAMLGPTAVYLNIIEDTNCGIEVIAQSENEQYGTVSGGGVYHVNTSVTLTATPNTGYEFQRWSNGRVSNPLTFTVVDDTVVTAYFRQSQNDINEIIDDEVRISTEDGYISVEGTTEDICIYDMMGRLVSALRGTEKKIFIPVSGVYMVKIGNHHARKVVVIR